MLLTRQIPWLGSQLRQPYLEWRPATRVLEKDEHYVVSLDVPGLRPEDLQVTVRDGVLALNGERRSEGLEVSEENSSGSSRFERRFQLPRDARADTVSAQLTDGVLRVTIPRAQPEVRQVEIATG